MFSQNKSDFTIVFTKFTIVFKLLFILFVIKLYDHINIYKINQSTFRIFPNVEWNLEETLIKKNAFGKYTSHNQRRQLSSFQNLIFESLIHSGVRFHISGLKHDIICVPRYSDLIFLWLKWALFKRLHDVSSFFLKIKPRAILGCALYISVASTCRFWWWILKDWSLSSSSSNSQIYNYKQVPNPFQEVYWFNCS